MTSAAVDPTLGAWLRRLPHYLYLADLIAGKRVLEVGCGTGYGAQFLANRGATRVIGIDRSLRAITEARSRHRQTNLEFRCEEPGSVELEDASVDCIFVPDGTSILRRRSVLAELRRLLARDGTLVLCGVSADRRGAPGGASFYEIRDRLERLFSPVRMIAQAPVVGFSLVEYGDEAEAPPVELDTSLLELAGGEPEPSDYVALCGGPAASPRGMVVVQLPDREGLGTVAEAVTGRRAEAEEPGDCAAAAIERRAEGAVSRELRLRLETAIEDRARAQAEADEARSQLEELRRQLGAAGAAPVAGARGGAGGGAARAAGTPEEAPAEPAPASHAAPAPPEAAAASPSEQIAEALAAHRDVVRSLEIAVEEGQAYAEELRAELEQALARAAEGERARQGAEERASRMEAELRKWRTRASTLEGRLMRLQAEAAAAPAARGPQNGEPRPAAAAPAAEPPPAAPPPAAAAREVPAEEGAGGEVASAMRDRVRRIEGELGAGRDLIRQIEEGLAVLEREAAREAATRAPSAWAAHRDQQLRELSAELGVKDAEITILHVGVSALRARLKELIAEVRRAAGAMRGRSAAEMLDVMDGLSARLASFEERE